MSPYITRQVVVAGPNTFFAFDLVGRLMHPPHDADAEMGHHA